MKLKIVLISFLSLSCSCIPEKPPKNIDIEQCIVVVKDDPFCSCRIYHVGIDKVGAVDGTLIDHPVEYCDKGILYRSDSYKDLTNWLNESSTYIRKTEELRKKSKK